MDIYEIELTLPSTCLLDLPFWTWLATTIIALLSTASLLHVEHVMSPLTLLLMQTGGAVLLKHLATYLAPNRFSDLQTDTHQWPDKSHRRPQSVLVECLASLIWILTYAILRVSANPLMVVMIVSLRPVLILRTAEHSQYSRCRQALVISVQAAAFFFLFRYDFRFTLGSGALLALLLVCSGALEYLQASRMYGPFQECNASATWPNFSTVLLTSGLALLSIWEGHKYGSLMQRHPNLLLVIINISSGAVALSLRGPPGTPLRWTPAYFPDRQAKEPIVPCVLVGVFGLTYHCWVRDTALPPQQILAYFIAIACSMCYSPQPQGSIKNIPLNDDKVLSNDLEMSILSETTTLNGSDDGDGQTTSSIADSEATIAHDADLYPGTLTMKNTTVVTTLLTICCWSFLLAQSLGILPAIVASAPVTHLDTADQIQPGLDIVVAYHDEPLKPLVDSIEGLLTHPQAESGRSRVVIYNKGSEDASLALKRVFQDRLGVGTASVEVANRNNEGREAETYLSHILDRWDDLATHTVFMQAALHEPAGAIQRLKDYLVPNTEFLSLSYVPSLCRDCSNCRDLSTWSADTSQIEWIWNMAYGNDSRCENIPLVYRGQFVASAARIRGGGRQMYQDLRQALLKGRDPVVTNSNSTMTSLDYGYLLERMWAVVMQCADERIANRCPTLASGIFGMFGSIEDCQCLDTTLIP